MDRMACVKSCGLAWHEAANGNRLTLPASHPSEAQRAMWQPVVLPGHGSVLYRASPSLVSRRPAARGIRCAAGEANSPKLVTFVGKGGAGKTIAALLAAQVGVACRWFADSSLLGQAQHWYGDVVQV